MNRLKQKPRKKSSIETLCKLNVTQMNVTSQKYCAISFSLLLFFAFVLNLKYSGYNDL